MGAKPRDHPEHMLLKLGLLKFVDINKYFIAVFVHRYQIARIPDVCIICFKRVQGVHHYATRICSGLYAMQVKTDLGKTGISYIRPIIWNEVLGIGINPDTSECVLTKSLKTCIGINLFQIYYVHIFNVSNLNNASPPLWICIMIQFRTNMKCDIYLKLGCFAQHCLICTLHPYMVLKKLSIRYGAHKPIWVSCSHCHVNNVTNDIILCSYARFVLNVCLVNRLGKYIFKWQ